MERSLSGHHSHTLVPRASPGTDWRFALHRKCASARGRSDDGPNRPVSEVNFSSSCSGLAIRTLAWAPAPENSACWWEKIRVWWTPDPDTARVLGTLFFWMLPFPYFERRVCYWCRARTKQPLGLSRKSTVAQSFLSLSQLVALAFVSVNSVNIYL